MKDSEYKNIWPTALYMNRENFAPFIEANALIFLWQLYDNDGYFEKQNELTKWGLENNHVKIEDGVIVTADSNQ